MRYYDEQAGGGGVRNVFVGSSYQRGRGVGAFLGGLMRKILPYITSGAKAVGKEAVRAGINVLDDVTRGGVGFRESVITRAQESKKNLKRKAAEKISEMMNGTGYKKSPRKRRRQSKKTGGTSSTSTTRKKGKKRASTKTKKRKTTKKNTPSRDITDIFGPK